MTEVPLGGDTVNGARVFPRMTEVPLGGDTVNGARVFDPRTTGGRASPIGSIDPAPGTPVGGKPGSLRSGQGPADPGLPRR